MTITLQTVNELISSMESAGELSIREQKFLKLAKEFKQLAAENVALKNAITDHSHSVHFCEVCGKDDPCSTDDVCYALKDIPATDRIVAGIKADGVEEFAAYQRAITDEWACKEGHSSLLKVAESAELFAKQLREGGDK
ncbi:hypothetical protein [Klebsiella quasipneumoniae]|uniref:hypothetical protein n=1 Tax=Klebsiella quasipneumoniae TaxID=1463165 RepID=UPI000E4D7F6A|nr:hypothetical protein [Klebsiella quasipneumoniae]MBC4168723.1 hypothetical protein [Klebsiella quasipneumoniae]MBX8479369.1 hypothetical protein [Klebsiella quasipneumoniae subsp. similipneumoniae]MBX9411491.1 hypothetical protein [Klebsiella quasipneumoniae subsp. similipneumoniae]MBX9417714.1 hypothetical protein [Klebsiella quasipneumoniae subsp. similipneumoniae]HBT4704261.1 hypothetical protein [Klebsiella quasipneumoniae subsp. similipneumoniae]